MTPHVAFPALADEWPPHPWLLIHVPNPLHACDPGYIEGSKWNAAVASSGLRSNYSRGLLADSFEIRAISFRRRFGFVQAA